MTVPTAKRSIEAASYSYLQIAYQINKAQSVGVVEYTDWICRAVRLSNEYPGYDIKQSDRKTPVMPKLWIMRSTLFIAITPSSTLTRSGSTW